MSPAAHARAEGEEKGRNVKAEQTRMRVACLTRASYMEASTDAEGDATIGDRTEHFCREAQGGGGFARVWVLCLRARARGTDKADGGTAQRACRQHSCLPFAIFTLSMRIYDMATSIARALSASDRQGLPRAGKGSAEGHRWQTTPSFARSMGANSR